MYNNCLCSTTCIENLNCKQIRALRSVPPFYTVFMKKERKGEGAYKNVKKRVTSAPGKAAVIRIT